MKRYFNNTTSIEELKKEYRHLCQINHPDNGGNVKIMADINAEYAKTFNELKAFHNSKAQADTSGKTRPVNECPEEFINIVSSVIGLKGIQIELCGSWIWISGDTFNYKDILKATGFKWASKKRMWYWRNKSDAVRNSKPCTMNTIRKKYGSSVFVTTENFKLTA